MEIPQFDPQQVAKAISLAKTPAGQELLAKLKQQSSKDLEQAIAQQDAGKLKELVQSFLNSPEGRSLSSRLGEY